MESIISDSSGSELSRREMEEKLVTVDRYLSEINEMSANYSIGHRNYEISKKGGEIVFKASSKDLMNLFAKYEEEQNAKIYKLDSRFN